MDAKGQRTSSDVSVPREVAGLGIGGIYFEEGRTSITIQMSTQWLRRTPGWTMKLGSVYA